MSGCLVETEIFQSHPSVLASGEEFEQHLKHILSTNLPWGYVLSVVSTSDYIEFHGYVFPPDFNCERIDFRLNGQPFDKVVYPHRCFGLESSFWFLPNAESYGFTCRINQGKETFFSNECFVFEFIDLTTQTVLNSLRNSYIPNSSFDEIPLPDAGRRIRVFGTSEEQMFRISGYSQFKQIEDVLKKEFGLGYSDFKHILDWGCGSGRVARYFKNLPNIDFTGVDIDSDNIGWCRQNLGFGNFLQSSLKPPLPLGDATVDLVIGISVFTHLHEQNQNQMLEELCRITKPGGVLLLTVNSTMSMTTMVYLNAPFYDKWRNEGFVYSSDNPALDGLIETGYYVNVFHTHEYIHKHWSRYFNIINIIPGAIAYQDLVILKHL